jgi:hypothetical protein
MDAMTTSKNVTHAAKAAEDAAAEASNATAEAAHGNAGDGLPPDEMSTADRNFTEEQSNADRENSLAWLEHNSWKLQVLTEARCNAHEPRARRWYAVAITVAWAAAFLAALGGVSIVADQLVLAGVLAITTAALSTFLATVKPADSSARHKTASANYRDLAWQFGLLDTDVTKLRGYVYLTAYDAQSGQYYDAGYFQVKAFSADVLEGLERRFRELGEKYVEAVKTSPSIPLNEAATLKTAGAT